MATSFRPTPATYAGRVHCRCGCGHLVEIHDQGFHSTVVGLTPCPQLLALGWDADTDPFAEVLWKSQAAELALAHQPVRHAEGLVTFG